MLLGSVGVSASADFQKGLTAYKSGDYATALREWELLAQQGDCPCPERTGCVVPHWKGCSTDAQYKQCVIYAKGQGVIRDNVYAHM